MAEIQISPLGRSRSTVKPATKRRATLSNKCARAKSYLPTGLQLSDVMNELLVGFKFTYLSDRPFGLVLYEPHTRAHSSLTCFASTLHLVIGRVGIKICLN